ncbi:hypothetical protein KSP39_PZI017083 [Platanthera zijinensis]|uniref:Uncharacterized protein n=1 Tax=Platanthera zijinensis TaxID=2320716 RepID=A0AAP0B6D3_9ASPA
MVHGILQFAPRIAFRCALHRCESQDIHCRESFISWSETVGVSFFIFFLILLSYFFCEAFLNFLHKCSTSLCPVTNTSMPPGGSFLWIDSTFLYASPT